jgi:hypothetical protein
LTLSWTGRCALAAVATLALGLPGASLAASKARAAAGPPDWSGVWANDNGGVGPGNLPELPLRPEAKVKVDEYKALVAPTGDTPGGVCLGAGVPSVILSGASYPLEVIQKPDQITLIWELHGDIRRIYFGKRNAPPEDRLPGRNGYSSGRWEGQTLVVETDNLVEQVDGPVPHSANAKVTERYTVETGKDGKRRLRVNFTVVDPDFYTAPVSLTKVWTFFPGGRLLPYECAEEFWQKHLEQLSGKKGMLE